MELLGEGLGLESEDLYKRLKLVGDIDEIIVETAPLIEAHRLDLDTVRDALLAEFAKTGG
jgi:heterodisulfide reductase subunit D